MSGAKDDARSEEARAYIDRYDAVIFARPIDDDASTEFFNVGYWADGAPNQNAACERLMTKLLAAFPTHEGKILDVACGVGGTTRALCEHYDPSNIVGINISPRQLERCRANAPGCRFEEMDAARLEFQDESFDRIVCVEAAFHFSTRARFLAEAYRVMRPEAVIAMADVLFRDRTIFGSWMVPEENDLKDLQSYVALFHEVGFRDVRVEDVTDKTWKPFFQRRVERFAERARSGAMSPRDAEQATLTQARMAEAVHHYVLVSATK